MVSWVAWAWQEAAVRRLTSTRLPSGFGFTVVLLCHVAAVLVSVITLVASALSAWRLWSAGGVPAPAVRSYFSGGTNWAGRALWLVPAFGAGLIAMSGGAYRWSATWVLCGIGLWVGAIAVTEGVLWPAERRVRSVLSEQASSGGGGAAVALARVVCLSALAALALVLAATAIMLAKP